jgi:hypothetical protein
MTNLGLIVKNYACPFSLFVLEYGNKLTKRKETSSINSWS